MFVGFSGVIMSHDEGSVARFEQGSESCDTLHKPGLVALGIAEEEGLLHLDDGGGKSRFRGSWGSGLSGSLRDARIHDWNFRFISFS